MSADPIVDIHADPANPSEAERALALNIIVKTELNNLEMEQTLYRTDHQASMVRSIMRFRAQMLSSMDMLRSTFVDVNAWKALMSMGHASPEETVIGQCASYEYCVRRALVTIRADNNGFMGRASLLQIIDNSVATAQLCRLIKCIHIDCGYISGPLYPSDAKLLENDSECRLVASRLRSMTACDLVPDAGAGTSPQFFGVTDTLTIEAGNDPTYVVITRFITLMFQAMNHVALGPEHVRFSDAGNDQQRRAYEYSYVGSWSLKEHASGVTETVSEILIRSKIQCTVEDMIKRLCSNVTTLVLLVEACAVKNMMNNSKSKNGEKRKVILERAYHTWTQNINWIRDHVPPSIA